MIDSMMFDRLVEDADAFDAVSQAIRERRIALFTTPVQEEQIAAIPDPVRRKQLRRLPREVVPPAVVVEGPLKHVADTVIAQTARARCDVLVTEDRRLAEEAAEDGIDVWDPPRLLRWLIEDGS
jgi:predicted nucleic acid-binding protein